MPVTYDSATTTYDASTVTFDDLASVATSMGGSEGMTLPSVSWTIDGIDTPLQGWSAGTTAFGGFSQMRGVIKESDARRYPSTVGQGSIVTGYTQGGHVVYQGRLSAPPAIRGGLASFAAQGESVRAAKRATRLNYQERGYGTLTDGINPPHADGNQSPNQLDLAINDGGVLIEQRGGETVQVGGYRGFCFWSPGNPIGRVAYDWLSSFADATWKLEIWTGSGPTTAGLTQRSTVGMGATSFSVDTGALNITDELMLLLQAWRGGAPAAMGQNYTLIKNLRVNGIALTDTFTGSQVITDVGGRLGYDTSKITSTGLNVLPLDWTQGSWAELLSYIATLEDRYWRVVEDGRLEYDAWGTKEWTVYQADGATVDLTPLELYNQVTVKYVDVGGAPREVTVTASPDPLAASGIVNVWTESLSDVQADATLATAVANNLLPRVSTLREQGRINAVKAYDHTGREAVREIRAGDTIRVADRDMNTATLHRVFETDQDSEGVACGIETGVSIASLLGRAGLASARAPSTAELPELEIAAIEAGESFPSEEQQHRERFLPWPEPFKKPNWRKLRG